MDLSNLTSWWTERTPAQKQWAERGVWLLLCLLCFTLGRCTAPAPMVESKTKVEEKLSDKTVWQSFEKREAERETKLASLRAEVESWKTKATSNTVEVKEPVLLRCPDRPNDKPIVATKTTTTTSTTSDKEGAKTDSTKTDSTVFDRAGETKETVRYETKYVDRVVTQEVKTYRPPDWRISLMVGGSFQTPLLPVAGPLVFGLSGERRLFSIGAASAWLGVWTLPQHGSVGGSLGVTF